VYASENRRHIPYNDYTKQQLNQIYVLEVKLVLLAKKKANEVSEVVARNNFKTTTKKTNKKMSDELQTERQQKQITGIMHIYIRKRRETWKDTELEGNIDKTSEHRNGHVTANL